MLRFLALAATVAGLLSTATHAGLAEDGGTGVFRLQSARIPKEITYSLGYYGRLLNIPDGAGPFNSLLENSQILDTAQEFGNYAPASLIAVNHVLAAGFSLTERFEAHVALPFYTQKLSYGPGSRYYTYSPFSPGDLRYGGKIAWPGVAIPRVPFPVDLAVLAGGSLPTSRGLTPVPTRMDHFASNTATSMEQSHADGTRRFGWHLGGAATTELANTPLRWPTLVHANIGLRKNSPLYALEHDFYTILSLGTGFETPLPRRFSVKGEYWHENRLEGSGGNPTVDDISLGLEYMTRNGFTFLAGAGLGLFNREATYVPFVDEDDFHTYNMNVRSSADLQIIVAVTYTGTIKERDRDGDGVFDKVDLCPDEPQGPDGKFGCPVRDRDRDGIPDPVDNCVDVHQGPDGTDGCPPHDRDGDTVCEPWVALAGLSEQFATRCVGSDKCPNIPGTVAQNGCVPPPPPPKLAVQEKKLILKGVNFETGKSVLLPTSFPVLDGLADQLLSVPEVELEVSGHTDNRGKRPMNMKLSQARAQAVRDYLVARGVAPERLTVMGYGPDRPVDTNDTPQGREQNRRVEFNRTK